MCGDDLVVPPDPGKAQEWLGQADGNGSKAARLGLDAMRREGARPW